MLLILLKTYTGIDVWKDVERFINWSHLTFSNMYIQKMKRIDFTYGVISLTIFLLSPLIFDVFGNLDSHTLVVAIGKDSFNEKPITFVYPSVTYGLIVFIFCNSLLLLFVGCDISMGKMTKFQIRCYRPYFLLHCLMCLVLCILRYVNNIEFLYYFHIWLHIYSIHWF